MIVIRVIPNMLDKKGRSSFAREYKPKRILRDYLRGFDYKNQKVLVTGKEETNFDRTLNENDEIILTPKVEDPIGFLVAVGKAIWAAAVAHPFVAAGVVLSTAYSVYSYLTRPRLPSINLSSDGIDQGSPTYDWNGGRTIQDINVPVPLGYGEHVLYGNVINQYQTTDGDKVYLNLLLLLCEGEIESISNIKINDNPIENYEDVSYETRLGTNTQTPITGFDDIHDVHGMSVNLIQSSSYTYTTVRTNVEALEIYLSFPSGLYQIDDQGNQLGWSVTYQLRYKLHGAGSWTDLGNTTINANHRTNFKRIRRVEGLAAGQYDVEITRISADSSVSNIGDSYLTGVDEITLEEIAYVNRALISVKALATNQLQGNVSSLKISCIAKMKKVSIPDVQYSGSPIDWEDYYWDPDTSQYKRLSDDAVCTWDGVSYTEGYCANPVWCRKDLYLNERYGLGAYMSSEDIDDDLYLEMSRYCEEKVDDGDSGYEKRFRLDVVLDSKTYARDLLSQLDSTFRAISFSSQNKLLTRVDKPQEDATQLFGMGNILEGSFSQMWTSPDEKYNVVEVQFNDKDKNYEMDSIYVIDDEAFEDGEEPNIRQYRYFGTKTSYAVREGQYLLRVSKYISRMVTFDSHMNAIAAQPGDRVDVSHDVPQIGYSGRVKSGSTTSLVKLDREVTVVSGTHKIRVAFADDTLEERTVSDGAGTYTELNVSSPFSSAPALNDNYSFGRENMVVEPMRIIDIERTNTEKTTVSCVPYIEGIYEDGTIVIPETRYSDLSFAIPDVEDLTLNELVVKLNDGTIENTIQVTFNIPLQTSGALKFYSRSKIYLSDDDGESWTLVGETSGNYFQILGNILTGQTYKVAVVSVTKKDEEGTLSESPQDSITIVGKAAPPSDVENFDVSQDGNVLRFSWDSIPDGDLSKYVIRKGSEWNTGQLVAEQIDVTEFDIPVGAIGDEVYMIKAMDTSGNMSVNPTIDEITVVTPPDMNFSLQIDPWALNREYILSGISRIKSNMYSPYYARDVFQLETSETWQDKEDEAKSWDQMITDGEFVEGACIASGYIEQTEAEAVDLETIFEFKIVTDLLYQNVSGGSITVQISYSEDNITWSSFANVSSTTNYRARYVRFKWILATSDTNHNVFFYAGTVYLNASNVKVDYGRDIAVDAGGTSIIFRDDFNETPRVTSLVIANNVLGIPHITTISSSGMTVKVYDPVTASYIGTAEVNWEVKGL